MQKKKEFNKKRIHTVKDISEICMRDEFTFYMADFQIMDFYVTLMCGKAV